MTAEPSSNAPLTPDRKPSYELPKRWNMLISREKWIKIRGVLQFPSGRLLPGLFFFTIITSAVYQSAVYYFLGPDHPRTNFNYYLRQWRGELDPEVKKKGDTYREYLIARYETLKNPPVTREVANYRHAVGKGFI